MTIDMNDQPLITLKQLEAFTRASNGITFVGSRRQEKYEWIERLLCRFFYFTLRKRDKVTVRNYLMKMTGYGEAQVTRLIRKQKTLKHILLAPRGARQTFSSIYTTGDVARLAEMDTAHGKLSGQATKKLCTRAHDLFHDERFVRLKHISVSHLYNLRGRRQYISSTRIFTKTRPTTIPIGQRRQPVPGGIPGYLRVDSVHQGDQDKEKGVYHINLVDEVTQWEIIGCVEGISEQFLIPLLEALLVQFPFRILGFHSDNGSEYVNYVVAKLLHKLSIEQTRSRPRKSNDNALVEGKNGSVIRKHMGYAHIPKQYASSINQFYEDQFNPYVNFHRPSGYATTIVNAKGKEKKVYRLYETPYAYFRNLPDAEQFLKAGLTFVDLDRMASATSDLDCAILMQKTKHELFKSFRK